MKSSLDACMRDLFYLKLNERFLEVFTLMKIVNSYSSALGKKRKRFDDTKNTVNTRLDKS